jgi:ADP-ribose pyrophosphatase YjhB (NUDIX family)
VRFVTRVGAYGVVRSAAGVLMVRLPAGPWAGSWDLPGGAIEPGESPADAVARHLQEALGLEVKPAELVLTDAVADVAEWETPDGITERLHRVAIVYEAGLIDEVTPTGDIVSAWSPLNPRTPLADRALRESGSV